MNYRINIQFSRSSRNSGHFSANLRLSDSGVRFTGSSSGRLSFSATSFGISSFAFL